MVKAGLAWALMLKRLGEPVNFLGSAEMHTELFQACLEDAHDYLERGADGRMLQQRNSYYEKWGVNGTKDNSSGGAVP